MLTLAAIERHLAEAPHLMPDGRRYLTVRSFAATGGEIDLVHYRDEQSGRLRMVRP